MISNEASPNWKLISTQLGEQEEVQDLLGHTWITASNNSSRRNSTRKRTIQAAQALYADKWKNKLNNEQKMRTYKKIKSMFKSEPYLNLKDGILRQSKKSLRISVHKLAIEMGRYSRRPTPADQRLCLNCETNQVVDEYHFLSHSSKYADDREELYRKNSTLCPNFGNLSSEDIFLLYGDV